MSYVRNPLVAWLLSHSYGQGGAVAVPSTNSSALGAPRGDFPAGIQNTLDHVTARYAGWNAQCPDIDWVFLVGGPGNGKSEALRALADALGIQLPVRVPGQPVPRTIPGSWPQSGHPLASGLEAAFVNDASIPRTDAVGTTSLLLDVRDALSRLLDHAQPVALFANVNRGVLVEEANAVASRLPSTPRDELAKAVIKWLAAPPLAPAVVSASLSTVVAVSPLAPQYGQFQLSLPIGNTTQKIIGHVVFLDTLSLLEPTPGQGRAVDFGATPPAVAPYRTLGVLVSTDSPRGITTAGKLVAQFVEAARWADGGCRNAQGGLCDAHARCPFAQNARWLQDGALQSRYLDTLRAAEIAAGRRFTYRDMLGHVALTVLGEPEEDWLGHSHHPCDWVAQQDRALQGGEKSASVPLVEHRIYSNLFSVSSRDSAPPRLEKAREGDTVFGALRSRTQRVGESPRLQAFEHAFNDIDPARDTDSWSGMRSRVLDAVEALDVRFPSAEVAHWTEVSPAAHSDIETGLDQVLREELAIEHEKGSRAASNRARYLRRWRAIELARQVALATGRVTNGDAIQAWLAEHENALRSGNRMPLGDGIYHLVLQRGTAGQAYLAPLRPRTYSITGDLPANTLLVPLGLSDLQLVIVPHGDTMLAEVQASRTRERLAPRVLASLVVDLAVAREAILHSTGNMRPFTEIGYTAFSRIERARASLVSRQRSRATAVYFTDEREQLYKLVPNPAGPAPLRVQKS